MFRSLFCLLSVASGLVLAASGELSNRRAPGFALPDPSYKHYYDLQDFAGKVVLIDIMSTRCPHCLLLSTTLEQVKGDKLLAARLLNIGKTTLYRKLKEYGATP